MAYTTNPKIPRVRGEALVLSRKGWSTRKIARHLGFNQSTIVRWIAKGEKRGYGAIPTENSRPKKSPRALPREIVEAIVKERRGRRRCAEVVHQGLLKKGVQVSLSSVKRTLDRLGLLKKRSPWKRPHDFTERPTVTHCGALLEVDTIHIMLPDGSRIYVYTIIDLFSRWAYAKVIEKIGAQPSVVFIRQAQKAAPFSFEMIQSDHGSEFSTWFTHGMMTMGFAHRHSRVRQSNDNAHIERFNRTIQEECLDLVAHTVTSFKKAIPPYLKYYNSERMHMGINFQTPEEVMQRY